jgi:hypothetical protein
MIARRRSPRRPKASSPTADRTAVLLEEVRAQNQLVLEAVVAHREQTDRHAADTQREFAGIRGDAGRNPRRVRRNPRLDHGIHEHSGRSTVSWV